MSDGVRLDKWLWAARFYKTRSQAAEAIAGGKVKLNGENAKPSKSPRPGDRLSLRIGPYVYDVGVQALSERRGPASAAQQLYQETEESLTARAALREQLRANAAVGIIGRGRPTKRERRQFEELHARYGKADD